MYRYGEVIFLAHDDPDVNDSSCFLGSMYERRKYSFFISMLFNDSFISFITKKDRKILNQLC